MKSAAVIFGLVAWTGLCNLVAAQQPHTDQEEQSKKLLSDLAVRLKTLRDAQNTVHDGIAALQKTAQNNPGKKLRPQDRLIALKLAAQEKEIHAGFAKIAADLKANGSAVAFMEVMELVGKDVKRVENSLRRGDLGKKIQVLEEDVQACITEMIEALTKNKSA